MVGMVEILTVWLVSPMSQGWGESGWPGCTSQSPEIIMRTVLLTDSVDE